MFASISAMRPKSDGMMLGMPRTAGFMKASF
jgi:hypothetical protein